MNKRYHQSAKLLQRAEKSIPLGSQTFSKSKIAYPQGVTPLFIEKGVGCNVWDVDNNQYIDFVSGLLSVSLGYCDNDVDQQVIKQLGCGVSFSLPHRLETELAEKLIELIPCAERVRFGKNGSDATSAAIRLARAYTNKEHIGVCGYHVWQDWYIGSTTRDLGVPTSTKALTHTFNYNDIDSLKALFKTQENNLAAIILEPMNLHYPTDNFLQKVKALCQQHGTLLIFDETITGFRYSLGGAQQLFGVIPDLATFGKGMANGYPISAIVGKKEIMALMADIFFSGTFAGETLSITAAKATLTKMQNEPVLEHIHKQGQYLIENLTRLIEKYQAQQWLSVCGHPSWSFLIINDCQPYSALQLKSLLLQEMLQQGILINASHNLSYAHQKSDIDALLAAYEHAFKQMLLVIKDRSFEKHFHGKLLEPVFKVR